MWALWYFFFLSIINLAFILEWIWLLLMQSGLSWSSLA